MNECTVQYKCESLNRKKNYTSVLITVYTNKLIYNTSYLQYYELSQ